MRIAWLVFNLDGMGGTSRSAITQANALAADHDVRLVSVTRSADAPHYAIDPRVSVTYLADVREEPGPAVVAEGVVPAAEAARLHARESALVPTRWDQQFSGLTDVALEAALPGLDVDVLVTVTPALLACAVQLLPPSVVVVHQEHRSTSGRTSGLEPLLAFAPRADVVAVLTPTVADWLRDQLGSVAPEIVVVPNPLPLGYAPRSRLDQPLIVAAGRLEPEKQFRRLVEAFGDIAERIPDWRLRILGSGFTRRDLQRQARKQGIWDRVELPGAVADMRGEWAKASVSALTSRSEGFPLVVQESMAAGVPVVSYDCASGPREIIDHEVNGLLVAPDSRTGLAEALLRVATDVDLRRRLGRGAYQTSQQYAASALAERWLGIFSDARARRAGRGRLLGRASAPAPRARSAGDRRPPADLTPAGARHAVLTLAAHAARSASDAWFVVPAHATAAPTVVLPISHRDAFLGALAAADAPAYLSLVDPAGHGWPERRGPVAELASDLRRGMTPALVLEPWPTDGERASLVGQGCSVRVEFWDESADGRLVAHETNPFATEVPRDAPTVELEIDGVTVRSFPLMAEPTLLECRFPVDVVYTWVDGSDPAWDAARVDRLAGMTGTALTQASSGRARFVSHDELRYSLRSLHLFAPWVRHIHLVTAGQVPDWLDTDHPQVSLVDHRDILPADALPTFNSHAIETALHRVPDLAEHFVYFNDDFLLARPVRPEAFFSPAGLPATYLGRQVVGLDDQPDAPAYLRAALNNRRLLQDALGVTITHHLAHAPYPHRRSVLEELEARFADELAATARAPFRSDTDVSTLSSLAQHYGLGTGRSYLASADLAYVDLAHPDADKQLRRLLQRDQDMICLAEHHAHGMRVDLLEETLREWFETCYPIAAPWERGSA
jgi:glycosyltransferase involved in cell wall biosynthesis